MRKRYFVPMNFIAEGYAFANVRWTNLIQAVCAIIVIAVLVFGLLPFGIKGKLYIGIVLIVPTALITLKGVNDLSITAYLADVLETRRFGKVYGKPNNADRISRQRNLERKRHKQLKEMEKERKRTEKEEAKLRRRKKNDEEE